MRLTNGGENDRIGRALYRTMKYRFDVVSIGIEDICGVIAWVVLAFTGSTIVYASCFECCAVEARNAITISSLKSHVYLRATFCTLNDKQLVGVEEAGAVNDLNRKAETANGSTIKAPA